MMNTQENAIHKSDCAMHNMPAEPAGPCDCRTDLSQASVAAALEAAAGKADVASRKAQETALLHPEDSAPRDRMHARSREATYIAEEIRALITPDQRTALQAAIDAAKAEARAEDAAWLPVEDAPQDGTVIITIKSNGDVAKGAWCKNPFGDENPFIDRASGKWWTAVGWLPMPKAVAQIEAKP